MKPFTAHRSATDIVTFHAFKHPYVFIVLYYGDDETRILGVYTDRETAEAKVYKHMSTRYSSRVSRTEYAILKKTIEGKRI